MEECKTEINMSIQRLFHWGAYCDKYGGTVQVLKFIIKMILVSSKESLNSDIQQFQQYQCHTSDVKIVFIIFLCTL